MAPALQLEIKRKRRPVIGEHHRVVIAAAVAAVVGRNFRILEINLTAAAPATGWNHCGPLSKPVMRAVLRQRIVIRTKEPRQEEERETANHS